MRSGLRLTLGLMLVWTLAGGSVADDAYREEIATWRREREMKLRDAEGWLSLVGLHWLDEGTTRLGSGIGSDVRLPASVPETVGFLRRAGQRVEFHPEPGVAVTRSGEPFPGGEFHSDADGPPDVLSIGPVRLLLIRRGDRLALRVKDVDSAARRDFAGPRWFEIDPSWRIAARFEPAGIPTRLEIDSIVGTKDSLESPGWVVFERGGRTHRLQAAVEGEALWFVFRDATAGRSTPENGRQLSADRPGPDGVVILDFNRAINLPCAYTPFATCPLPPRQNRLDLAIPAGERRSDTADAPTPGR